MTDRIQGPNEPAAQPWSAPEVELAAQTNTSAAKAPAADGTDAPAPKTRTRRTWFLMHEMSRPPAGEGAGATGSAAVAQLSPFGESVGVIESQVEPGVTSVAPPGVKFLAIAPAAPRADALKIGPASLAADSQTAGAEENAPDAAAPAIARMDRWSTPRWSALAVLLIAAASAAIGATAAGLVGNALVRGDVESISARSQSAQEAVARLRRELDDLRSGIQQASHRGNAGVDELAGRLSGLERAHSALAVKLDSVEKAQRDAMAKLASTTEQVEDLQQRTPAPVLAADTTSIMVKQTDRPPTVEGWRVIDFAGQRAVVENRNGSLYEVSAGSNVPGLGVIETIRRQGSRVIVVTRVGVISAMLEPPRYPAGR